MLCGYKFIVLCIQTRRNPSEVLEFSIKIAQLLRHQVRHVKQLPAKLQKQFQLTGDKLSLGNATFLPLTLLLWGSLPRLAPRGGREGLQLCASARLVRNRDRPSLGLSIIDNSEQCT